MKTETKIDLFKEIFRRGAKRITLTTSGNSEFDVFLNQNEVITYRTKSGVTVVSLKDTTLKDCINNPNEYQDQPNPRIYLIATANFIKKLLP